MPDETEYDGSVSGPSEELSLGVDELGAPVLLAVRKPGQVAAQPDPSGAVVFRGARSGNAKADPVTGRFAGGKTTKVPAQDGEVVVQQTTRTLPQGLSVDVYERRMDIVRELARENDDLADGDIKEFLRGHPSVKNVAAVDLELLKRDVRAQRLDDLIDILDAQMRTRVEGMRRSRRFVRIAAPRGFTKRVFAGLDDNEVIKLVNRLEGRGWDPEDLTKHVISRIGSEERRTKLEQLYGEQRPKSGKRQRKKT